MAVLRRWGVGGYDEIVTDRYLYAFAAPNDRLVKVGMVLDEGRLRHRLRDVRRNERRKDLEMIAHSVVPNVNHEETEHIESVARLWLVRVQGFSFVGKVDWLLAPEYLPQSDWQSLLDKAVMEGRTFGVF